MRRLGGSRWMVGLLAGALALGAAGVDSALGQGAGAGTASSDAEAHRLFAEGMEAVGVEAWSKAHGPLSKAFALKRHWKIAANLGKAEAKLGMHRDAAEHLDFFLTDPGASGVLPADRVEAEAMRAEARTKVATLTVTVDAIGADVLINGKKVGESPLPSEKRVYVTPGKYVVEARKKGYRPEREEIQVGVGSSRDIIFELKEDAGGGWKGEGGSGGDGEGGNGSGGAGGPVYPPGSDPAWQKPLAIGLGVGAAVGVGAGVGFTFASNGRSTDADTDHGILVGMTAKGIPICKTDSPEVNKPSCDALEADYRAAQLFKNLAVTGFVVGGVALAGAVIVALLPLQKSGKDGVGLGVRISPVISASDRGVLMTGSF